MDAAERLDDLRIRPGKGRISADTALRLARFFGTSERFWMNLQGRYDLETEGDRLAPVLDEITPLRASA
jgi:addiction module HigA family antidote